MWAWEYLRRNFKYQQLCDEIGVNWFDNFRKLVFEEIHIKEDEFLSIINPVRIIKYKLESEVQIKIYKQVLSIYNKITTHNNNITDKFKLITPDHYSSNIPITIFNTDIKCIRRAKGNKSIKNPLNFIRNHPNANRVRSVLYLDSIETALDNYRKICGDIKFDRDPSGNVHLKYLRVYDANNNKIKDKTISDEEISKIIYGSSNKLSSIEMSYRKSVEYIEGKYIALAAPLYKE